MRGSKKEHWLHLCELVAEEQDPARFSELTKQLLAELEAKDRRLKSGDEENSADQPGSSE